MDNITRRQLLDRHRRSGFPGSIIDVYKAHEQGIDLIGQFEQQQMLQKQNIDVASSPQEVQQGLRPAHEAGDVSKSMVFPNIPPNTPFNTVGMKAPINIQKFDNQGHLVKSYENVPPGIKNLPMGPHQGTVLETPAKMKTGGVVKKYQWAGPKIDGPRVPAMSDAEMSLKILQEANAGNPAARRMRSDYGQRMFLSGETDPSTHYMTSFDSYAVPTVQEDYIGGSLSYNPNPAPSKADFKFDTPEQAAYFAKNYKQASAAKTFQQKNGGVRKAQNGLPPYYASSKNDPRYIAYNDSLNLNLATLAQDRLMGPGSNKSTDNIDYWTPEQLQDARTPKYHPILGYAIARDYQSQEDQFQDEDGDGKIDYNFTARKEDEQLINYYKSLGFTDDNIMYHSSPDLVHPTIKPSYTYFDGTADSPYYVAPKQEVILSSKLPLIQPKQISTSIQAPELQIPKIPTYLNSTPIYRQDPSVSTSQYQIGENMWDPNKKQWFRSIFDKEMQGAFRQNAKPRKEKWRTIETPPGGFKTGGIRKYQTAGELTLGQTSPDWRATGPGLRIDGQTYQNSQLTGATRVPLNPETGDQLPIMLPAAEVVGRRDYDDSIAEAVSRTNSGLLGSRTSAQDYAQMKNAVRSGMNTAGNNMLAAAGDILSSPQRYAVNAPLAYAMGKTPNLSMFPSADRNLGINQPNAFPSETLGVTNPIGAFAVDALTDPTAIAGIGATAGRTAMAAGRLGKQALNATIGQGIRNIAYHAVDPFTYNPHFHTPKEILRNIFNPAARPAGSMKSPTIKDLEYLDSRARRLDAFALSLGKKPRYGTLRQVGENTYEPVNGTIKLDSFYSNVMAARSRRSNVFGTPNDLPGSTINLIDNTFGLMGGYHLTDEAVKGYPLSRHFQMNDTWDLHPFQGTDFLTGRGKLDNFMNNYTLTRGLWNTTPPKIQKALSNRLQNFEVLSALGGKPINLQSSWTATLNSTDPADWLGPRSSFKGISLTNNATGQHFSTEQIFNGMQTLGPQTNKRNYFTTN